MRTHLYRGALLGAALAAAACASTPAISNTNNIVRATDVEMVCLEFATSPTGVTTVVPHPTARCALSDTDNGPGANATFHLHAVVPQFDRGELAIVDLASTSGVALVDNSPATPGYSFLPVGEFPVSVTSDVGEGSGYVFVASGRSDRVLRIDAAALREDPRRAGFISRRTEIPVGGLPRELAVVRAGDRHLLVAALPESRAVSFVDITDPNAPGMPQLVSLAGGSAGGDAGAAVPAHPVALAVDADAGRLYVTDDALDRVHVIDVASRAELAPLAVGARTRAAAVTGNVRLRSFGAAGCVDVDHCAQTRYLYLTTADEGAVIVWDLTRGARVNANLLPTPNVRGSRVDPGLPVDRVALGAPATALVAINTSAYDPAAAPISGPQSGCGADANYVPPTDYVLSGVYVGVVLRTGQLAIIDVDDYSVDAWEARCGESGRSGTASYRFVRHAPHALRMDQTIPALTRAPAITSLLGTTAGRALEATSSPTLACRTERTRDVTPDCMTNENFGVTLANREGVTGSNQIADPYTARNEEWSFVYEDVIPGLDQPGGALVADASSGALRLDAPGGYFCTRGTLANDRARDVLVLVSDPTPLAADRDDCAQLFGSGALPLNRDFVIDRAFEDHLELRAPGGAITGDRVRACFPQAVRFQVRAGQQWVAVGSSTGYAHAVRVGAGRECEIDPVKQTEVEGLARGCLSRLGLSGADLDARVALVCPAARACTGTVSDGRALRRDAPMFANPFLCTQIYPTLVTDDMMRVVAGAVDRGTQLKFAVAGAYQPFLTATGQLPVVARHLRGVDRLYVVDSALNGLMEFRFNPFASGRIFN